MPKESDKEILINYISTQKVKANEAMNKTKQQIKELEEQKKKNSINPRQQVINAVMTKRKNIEKINNELEKVQNINLEANKITDKFVSLADEIEKKEKNELEDLRVAELQHTNNLSVMLKDEIDIANSKYNEKIKIIKKLHKELDDEAKINEIVIERLLELSTELRK